MNQSRNSKPSAGRNRQEKTENFRRNESPSTERGQTARKRSDSDHPRLRPDGANLVQYFEDLQLEAEEKMGTVGRCFKDRLYPKFPVPVLGPEYNGLTPAQQQASLARLLERRAIDIKDFEENKVKCRAMVKRGLSQKILDDLQRHRDFVTNEASRDPIQYCRMIEEVVALGGRAQTIAFTHEQMLIKYVLFRQIAGETLVGCHTRFKNHIDQWTLISGAARVPNGIEQAERFKNCLSSGYDRMRELYTEQRTRPVNPEPPLASLEDMYQLAQTQDVAVMSAKSVNAQYYPSAFTTDAEFNQNGSDFNDIPSWVDQCRRCGVEGHKQWECTKEQQPRRSSGRDPRGHDRDKYDGRKPRVSSRSPSPTPARLNTSKYSAKTSGSKSNVKKVTFDKGGSKRNLHVNKTDISDLDDEYNEDDYNSTVFATLVLPHSDMESDCQSSTGEVYMPADEIGPVILMTKVVTVAVDLNEVNNRVSKNNYVILDGAAQASVFFNQSLLCNIRQSERGYRIQGIGGYKKSSIVGDIPSLGQAIVADVRANILSQHVVEQMYWLEYKQNIYYRIHLNDTDFIEFEKCKRSGNYICNFDEAVQQLLRSPRCSGVGGVISGSNDHSLTVCATVAEREAEYSPTELKAARGARDWSRKMGYTSCADLATLVSSGGMLNCPFTTADIWRSDRIYGKDVPILKGKSTVRHKVLARTETIARPLDEKQAIHCDVMFYRSEAYVLAVIKPLNMLVAIYIGGRTAQSSRNYHKAFITLRDTVQSQGFRIHYFLVDGERALAALEGKIPDVTVYAAAQGHHVPVAERAIRVIKERCRCIDSGLPYTVPLRLARYEVYFVVSRINAVPRKSGGATSASEKFKGVKLDYARDVRLGFGDYVQCVNDIGRKNTPAARTVGCIALCPTNNLTGAWKFYALDSARVITRDAFTELPTPDVVIEHIERLAAVDKGIQIDTEPVGANLDVDELDGSANSLVPPDTLAGVTAAGFTALPEEPLYKENERNDMLEMPNSGLGNSVTNNVLDDTLEQPLTPDVEARRRSARIAGKHVPTVFKASVNQDVLPHLIYESDLDDNESVSKIVFKTNLDEEGEPVQLPAKKAVELWGGPAKDAIRSEFAQLGDMGVLEAISPNEPLTKPPLPCSMFVRIKRNKKLKGRFVAGGHRQNRNEFLDRSAPTVGIENVFLLLAAACCNLFFGYIPVDWVIATMDVTGAFLEVPLVPEEQEVLKLSPYLTALLQQSGQFIDAPLDRQGRITVRCLKALYGLVVSAKRFYDHISQAFVGIGLKCCRNDPCIFFGIIDGHCIYLCIHVDDLLVISDKVGVEIIANCLRKRYRDVKITLGDTHDYLGMVVTRTAFGVTVQMYAYVEKCIAQYSSIKEYKMPAALTDFFVVTESLPLLDEGGKSKFHSTVAMLLYLAKRVRCDILLAVSFLAGRVSIPNTGDLEKLLRVLGYLKLTWDWVLKFGHREQDAHTGPGSATFPVVETSADASHAVHPDLTSRSASINCVEGNFISAHTQKQVAVVKSSCEAELVCASASAGNGIHNRAVLMELGCDMGRVRIYQDNQTVLALMQRGRSNSSRTRHIRIQEFWLHDQIDLEEIEMVYMPTEDMIADLLTKPLSGDRIKYLCGKFGLGPP